MVGANIANIGHGGDRNKSPIGGLKQSEAAQLLNTSERNIQRATKVQESGVPEFKVEAKERLKEYNPYARGAKNGVIIATIISLKINSIFFILNSFCLVVDSGVEIFFSKFRFNFKDFIWFPK